MLRSMPGIPLISSPILAIVHFVVKLYFKQVICYLVFPTFGAGRVLSFYSSSFPALLLLLRFAP